jgi:uncharacterized protein YdaU (DUF1376 family)
MHFYPFHIGDYMAHTRHLSPMEDLAYRRMIDAAHLGEAGLEGDAAAIARAIGLRDHAAEVASVLSDFWHLADGVWRNKRVDAEVARYREKQHKAAASAAARWKNPMRTHSDRNASALHPDCEGNATKNHEPGTMNQEPQMDGRMDGRSRSVVEPRGAGRARSTPSEPRPASDFVADALRHLAEGGK